MHLAHAVAAQRLTAHATERQYAAAPDEAHEAEHRAIRRAERVANERRLTERGRHLAPRPSHA